MHLLERFTSVEAAFSKHAVNEGKNDSIENLIFASLFQGDVDEARQLYLNGIKALPLESARDTLLLEEMKCDDLEGFIRIMQAPRLGASSQSFRFNEDGQTYSIARRTHSNFGCDDCMQMPICGQRYTSVQGDIDLCERCYGMRGSSRKLFFVLGLDRGGIRVQDRDTLLHIAIGAGAATVVEWLVSQFGADPFENTIYGFTAMEMCDLNPNLEEAQVEKMRNVMIQCKRRREFLSTTTLLLKTSTATYDDLIQLGNCITSVYDLRTVFSFGNANLSAVQLKQVLLNAFQLITKEKLLLDDDASLYFDFVLEECQKRDLLTAVEARRWVRENMRLNMENAAWVKEIKQSIQKLTAQVEVVDQQLVTVKNNIEDLKNALIAQEEAQVRREKCKRIVSLVSMGLCMVGGPIFEQCFNTVIDFAVPVNLLHATLNVDQETLAGFLADKATQFVFKDGVEALLIKAQVDPVDFVDVLRNVVVLEQSDGKEPRDITPVSVKQTTTISHSTVPKEEGIKPIVAAVAPRSLGKTESKQPKEVSSSAGAPSFAVSKIDESKLEEHEFHHAVYHSGGELDAFIELVDMIDNFDLVNSEMDVEVVQKGGVQVLKIQPQVLASYMGYDKIAEYFFDNFANFEPKERKITTLTRAKKAASSARNLATSTA
ncbi:Aste57867_13951 [Aphanomyces stellatus]|uniref:Aste57867_13951 protein n=1 Tax=Aphanomyces stellatus TaxID=120398 RepID=A0A485L0D0_9STRA|nr:hypothetical protein As57867_013900 [Aphanomyces stellatus]VFT90781.1 Aste57867_13951 [Aphanomyces stellatus]